MSAITANLQAIGPYRLQQRMGFNGMFATFSAVDVAAQSGAAIVAVHTGHITARETWQKTEKDLLALTGLQSPRVCPFQRAGEDSGHFFAAYGWLEGQHLGMLVRDGGLPDHASCFRFAAHVAEGLASVHRKGVIHRILSPASIFVTRNADAHLLHAGWGRLILGAKDGLLNPTWGCILPFVSPELAAGKDLDEAADVYALGANLYFLLSGAPPFWHDDPATLHELIANERPDFAALPSALPPDAREVIEELMSHSAEDRPVNLPALSDRLQSIARKLAPSAAAAPSPFPTAGRGQAAAASASAAPEPIPVSADGPETKAIALPPSARHEGAAKQEAPAPPKAAKAAKPIDKKLLLIAGALAAVLILGGGAAVVLSMGSKKEEPAPTATPAAAPKPAANGSALAGTTAAVPAPPQDKIVAYDDTITKLRALGQYAAAWQRKTGSWTTSKDDLIALGATVEDLSDAWATEIDIRGEFIVSAGENKKWDDDDDVWWEAGKNLRGGFHPVSSNP
jgi:serine/threonine-protein kinase